MNPQSNNNRNRRPFPRRNLKTNMFSAVRSDGNNPPQVTGAPAPAGSSSPAPYVQQTGGDDSRSPARPTHQGPRPANNNQGARPMQSPQRRNRPQGDRNKRLKLPGSGARFSAPRGGGTTVRKRPDGEKLPPL